MRVGVAQRLPVVVQRKRRRTNSSRTQRGPLELLLLGFGLVCLLPSSSWLCSVTLQQVVRQPSVRYDEHSSSTHGAVGWVSAFLLRPQIFKTILQQHEGHSSARLERFTSFLLSSSSSSNSDKDDLRSPVVGSSTSSTSSTATTPNSQNYSSNLYGYDEDDDVDEILSSSPLSTQSDNNNDNDTSPTNRSTRRLVTQLAKTMIQTPLTYATLPTKLGQVLKEATFQAVDLAVDEVMKRKTKREQDGVDFLSSNHRNNPADTVASSSSSSILRIDDNVLEEAFQPMEESLQEMEEALQQARKALERAKEQTRQVMEATFQAAAVAQGATQVAWAAATVEDILIHNDNNNDTTSAITIDYASSEMAPPFLGEDQCLVPGAEPVVRVEKAPQNSRRIFAGIDILASVDAVWNVLTDYSNLQNVVPNLVVNDVLELYPGTPVTTNTVDGAQEEYQRMASQLKGSLLRQVGGAKVAGINFSARTTLEVREWPQGLPDSAHFDDETYQGKSRQERAQENTRIPLERYRFPRPFAISSLPTRDITMQSIEDDSGEFRLYQGVWRMQPLPGCAPPGKEAMRLTYAVEISPRAYLPVQLVEGRIVKDLKNNLEAIREYVEEREAWRK